MEYEYIKDTAYAGYFSQASFLPTPNKKPFEVELLKISVNYNPQSDEAAWIKEYKIKKVGPINDQESDIWFEVTGCPSGKFEKAYNNRGPEGYAFSTYLDAKDNLIHFFDFGKNIQVGDSLVFTTKFTTKGHDKENKLLVMERMIFFKKMLFRYDYGTSMPIAKLLWVFTVVNGRIMQAWPKTISQIKSEQEVTFEKINMRVKEVFTPLIQIESGSRLLSKAIRNSGIFLIGFIAGIAANAISSVFNW